jgi:hypothetical protein
MENTKLVSQIAPRVLHQPLHTRRQPLPLHKKFTPASRHSRITSWQQRMQLLFARQSY